MIISCPSCKKKFEIDASLIPNDGRILQCGSCNHKWFYNKHLPNKDDFSKKIEIVQNDIPSNTENIIKEAEKVISKKPRKKISNEIDEIINKKDTALIKYEKKTQFTFSKFLRYIIVCIISFVALLVLLDTFKNPLSNYIPNIEQNLYSLFEIFKDIISFTKDLIK